MFEDNKEEKGRFQGAVAHNSPEHRVFRAEISC